MILRAYRYIVAAVLMVSMLAAPLPAVGAGPPDVAVSPSDIAFSNDFPKTGEIVTINVTVHNIGGLDSGAVNVKFFVEGIRYLPDKTIANIPVNGTSVASTGWPATIPTTYTIKVELECPADTNAANNVASRTITVGAPAGPLLVNMALDPAVCKPEQTFWANGSVRLGIQPVSNAEVKLTVNRSGSPVITTTDALGNFSANLTAPKGANRYEVEAAATSGSLKGNDTKTLTVILPDMVISALTSSKDKPAEGDDVVLTATLKNNGTDAVESFMVAFYDGNAKFTTVKAGPLSAGNSTPVTVTWKAVKGTRQLKALADPDNKVAEINENDNSITVTLTVNAKNDGGDNMTVILIIAVVVVAAAAIAGFAVMRSRKKKAE